MIRDLLLNKTAAEKVNIKSIELAKLSTTPKLQRENGFIEISKPVKINGGIRVYVRAWDKDDNPVGFGKDGTIETEKFNIINPPILVSDLLGDIDASRTDDKGVFHERRVREDLQEALIRSLERTIKTVGKDGKNIIKGSIGNTTTTIYTTQDGYQRIDGSLTWSQAHNGNGAAFNIENNLSLEWNGTAGAWTRVSRNKMLCDTSTIPDTDTISSVTLTLNGSRNDAGDVHSAFFKITNHDTDNNAAAEFQHWLALPPVSWSDTSVGDADVVVDNDNVWTFNATGIAGINKTGITGIGLVLKADFDDSEPGGTGNWQVDWYNSFVGTADQDPFLTIVHAATPNNYTSTRSETLTLIDNPAKATAKPITNALTLIDTITQTLLWGRTLSEIITLVDDFARTTIIAKALGETITLADTIARAISKALSDVVTLVDALTKGLSLSFILTETVTLTDSLLTVIIGWLFGSKAATNWTNAGKASTTWTFTTENQSSYNP